MALQEKTERVYEYIRRKISEGLPPTVREIAHDLGIKSTSTVHRYLSELCEQGYIEKGSGQNRSIRLTSSSAAAPVPVLGKVAAGYPITAIENIEEYVMFGAQYDPAELFGLRVQGESMKNVGIMDGDIVIVLRRDRVENGTIAVALIDDEATVKRFFKEKGHFVLQPENEAFEPIVVDAVTVLGPVVGVLRFY